MATEPVHIGTGGYRLGRVDLSIAREPGTNLPKIPGTGLHGAIRHYAAYRYNALGCAGQKDHCGKPECPICYTFGYAKGDPGGYAGVISTGDARILLFPVSSASGPVWVSTKSILEEAGCQLDVNFPDAAEALTTLTGGVGDSINLGWLMLKSHKAPDIDLSVLAKQCEERQLKKRRCDEWQTVSKRLVIVRDSLFSRIVNSNLEVRTSVSINPQTGAAEEKALFTHESIPRATILWFEIVCDDYRAANNESKRPWNKDNGNKIIWRCHQDGNNLTHNCSKGGALYPLVKNQDGLSKKDGGDKTDAAKIGGWSGPLDVAEAGLDWLEYLGVGGMSNRGFGRLRSLGYKEVDLK